MKILKSIVFALVALLAVRANPLQPKMTFEVIALEEACVRQGGICVRYEDCNPGNLVQVRGVLCPNQQHLGVECCYL